MALPVVTTDVCGTLPPLPHCVEFLFLLVGRRLGVRERIINIPNKSAGEPALCAKVYIPRRMEASVWVE